MAKLIVCEKTGRWATAWRQAIDGSQIFETRSLADCWEELTNYPASLIALETTSANLEQVATWIARLGRFFPSARAVVLAQRTLQPAAPPLREAGAIHFLCTPRKIDSLARLAERHLATAPKKPRSPSEQIRDRLPWGRN